jgi:hypothetical protein
MAGAAASAPSRTRLVERAIQEILNPQLDSPSTQVSQIEDALCGS